eukprot:TRINITY_DN4825_c0_g1_i1.p1 TRINITY_DN4825_c0_g1~~TRINITY_DN4825_c0_g1_i1.p1  ORF type:complete len:748 (+),score=134.24 TRINITY_DN4825_c0_g1_i1:201-2444(+)
MLFMATLQETKAMKEPAALEEACRVMGGELEKVLLGFFAPEFEELARVCKTEQRDRHRSFVVNELVQTENEYVTHLKTITDFWQPEIAKSNLLSSQELYLLFGNVPQMVALATQIADDLKSEVVKEPQGQRIGAVFLKKIPFFRIYSEFTTTRDQAYELLKSSNKKASKFNVLLEKLQGNPILLGLRLDDFLIKPTQRVMKYPLLLRDLIHSTAEGHADYADLVKANEAMTTVLADINNCNRTRQTGQALGKLVPNLTWKDQAYDLVASHVQLVVDGQLKCCVYHQDSVAKGNWVYLFDACLLVTKHRAGKWDEVAVCMLADCMLQDDPEAGGVPTGDFVVCDTVTEERIVFSPQDSGERSHWVNAFRDTLKSVPANKTVTRADSFNKFVLALPTASSGLVGGQLQTATTPRRCPSSPTPRKPEKVEIDVIIDETDEKRAKDETSEQQTVVGVAQKEAAQKLAPTATAVTGCKAEVSSVGSTPTIPAAEKPVAAAAPAAAGTTVAPAACIPNEGEEHSGGTTDRVAAEAEGSTVARESKRDTATSSGSAQEKKGTAHKENGKETPVNAEADPQPKAASPPQTAKTAIRHCGATATPRHTPLPAAKERCKVVGRARPSPSPRATPSPRVPPPARSQPAFRFKTENDAKSPASPGLEPPTPSTYRQVSSRYLLPRNNSASRLTSTPKQASSNNLAVRKNDSTPRTPSTKGRLRKEDTPALFSHATARASGAKPRLQLNLPQDSSAAQAE